MSGPVSQASFPEFSACNIAPPPLPPHTQQPLFTRQLIHPTHTQITKLSPSTSSYDDEMNPFCDVNNLQSSLFCDFVMQLTHFHCFSTHKSFIFSAEERRIISKCSSTPVLTLLENSYCMFKKNF